MAQEAAVTTRVSVPAVLLSTCRQCHHPIRRELVSWNHQWQREDGVTRCMTMIGCIPEVAQ